MAVNILTTGPGSFSIGPTGTLKAFQSQVTSCKLVPKTDQDDAVYVLSGESVPGDRKETWTIEGEMLQDFGTTDGLTEWLFTHRGEEQEFTFVPSTAKGKKITGKLVVEPTEIGGDVMKKAKSEFKFQLVGAPTIAAVAG